MKKLISVLLPVFLIMCLISGCGYNYRESFKRFDVAVTLDTPDDIYAVTCDYSLDGKSLGLQGASNADETKITDGVYFEFDEKNFEDNPELGELSLSFGLYDRLRQSLDEEERVIPVDGEIKIEAQYGREYRVTISGDKQSGFRAVLAG
ncbi:MAG: hypothetical protein IKS19_01365 [Clostridia bacterium]|nr:hypothetical protein [Clostridia bacterium]